MWDWLTDGIGSLLESVVDVLLANTNQILDIAKITPADFMEGTIWAACKAICTNVVQPIGWSVLTLFLLIELASLFKRQDARGPDSIYFITMVIVKIGCAKLLMDNLFVIVEAIFQLSSYMMNQTQAFIGTTVSIQNDAIKNSIKTELDSAGLGILQCLLYFVYYIIMYLIATVTGMLCKIVVYLRFIEIFVWIMIAPIPVATWPNQEYSSMFKNWVKRLIAQGIHVILIGLCIYIYATMIATVRPNGIGTCWEIIAYTLLLVIALFQSSGWSKSIASAS